MISDFPLNPRVCCDYSWGKKTFIFFVVSGSMSGVAAILHSQ